MRILYKFGLLTFFLLAIATSVFAQKYGQEAIDSLQINLETSKPDTNRVWLIYGIAVEYQALDADRVTKTMARIEELMELKTKATLFETSTGGNSIYIKEGHEQIKVKLHDIHYLEALKDYTLLVTPNKRHRVLSNIGNLLKQHHFHSFLLVRKSYTVQKHFAQKIGVNEITLSNNISVPVGRSYKKHIAFL